MFRLLVVERDTDMFVCECYLAIYLLYFAIDGSGLSVFVCFGIIRVLGWLSVVCFQAIGLGKDK